MIDEVKRKNVAIVFVYAPIYYRLKENLDEDKSMLVYQDLSERYGIPILDFSEMDINVDTAFFKDANHLNDEGARRFTEELAHSIDSLGLVQNDLYR